MSGGVDELALHLAGHGVRETFGVTGSGLSLKLIAALEHNGVAYYPVAHEAAAALMAGAVFWQTGRLSAAISIKGPGFVNMLPGIACNHLDSRASVTISEAYGDDTPIFRRHKRLDQIAVAAPVLKGWTALGAVPDTLPGLLDSAAEEVPGPIHIELCNATARMADQKTGARPQQKLSLPPVLDGSRRPVVIAGSLARRREWGKRLASLQCPVFTTASAKGVVDERLPFAAGVYTGDGRELTAEWSGISAADCVIGLGLRNIEVVNPRSFGTRGVLADEIGGYTDGFDGAAVVDPGACDLILDKLEAGPSWGSDLIADARTRLRDLTTRHGWDSAGCVEVLNRQPFDYTLVVDTGAFCTVVEHCWVATPERAFIGSGNGRFMGVGLPTAIGAAFTARHRPLVCITGDGGVRPYLPELALAAEESLPLCVVLMSDGIYGSVRAAAPPPTRNSRALQIGRPSWWRAVEGMGIDACRVESIDDFETAFAEWPRVRPMFIEATFDADDHAMLPSLLRT